MLWWITYGIWQSKEFWYKLHQKVQPYTAAIDLIKVHALWWFGINPSCRGLFPPSSLHWTPTKKSAQTLLFLPAACEMSSHLDHNLLFSKRGVVWSGMGWLGSTEDTSVWSLKLDFLFWARFFFLLLGALVSAETKNLGYHLKFSQNKKELQNWWLNRIQKIL